MVGVSFWVHRYMRHAPRSSKKVEVAQGFLKRKGCFELHATWFEGYGACLVAGRSRRVDRVFGLCDFAR